MKFSIELAVSFVLLSFVGLSGSVNATEPLVKDRDVPGDNDEYWTPERLREAQPLELPHPTTPLSEEPSAEKESTEPAPLSVSGPGNPGDAKSPSDGDRLNRER